MSELEFIAKKYKVLKHLGSGAMGDVYLVMPPRGDAVALKLLKTLDSKSNIQAIEQFENEFKVLKKLSHPNIGTIYDYGYDEALQKVFFTLPWLHGTDIYMATKDMPFEKCEELFVEVLRALNYLHQKNLIHCDLKPGNIYVENGHVVLIDFGLAGYWGENIVGTPTYLAPEIYRGIKHSITSDLYACGVIIYNCLTRTQPFAGKNLQEVYDRHRNFTPPPIHEINPAVPKYFSDIIALILNKKPEERLQNAAAVIEEIDAFSKQSYSVETEQTLLSYLPTQSDIIGRKEEIKSLEHALSDFLDETNKKPNHVILIYGRKGVGKGLFLTKIRNDLQIAKCSIEEALPPFSAHDHKALLSSRAVIFRDLENHLSPSLAEKNHKAIISLIEEKTLHPEIQKELYVFTSINEKDFESVRQLFPEEDTQITTIELLPYTKRETNEFLSKIIGISEIPATFIEQFHRNTNGLPSICQKLIQILIQDGKLFDRSGRWNEDLLGDLNRAFENLDLDVSLEQEFEKIYGEFSDQQAEIINWLSICSHGLSEMQLALLTKDQKIKDILSPLLHSEILREENNIYYINRTVFRDFVASSLPESDVKRRHTRLAYPDLKLSKLDACYHLSFGQDENLRRKATVKLAELYEAAGKREHAAESYERLISENLEYEISERLEWIIAASMLMIWLDRFKEATNLLTSMEKEIIQKKPKIDTARFLVLMEKKGLALLHQERVDEAHVYFERGLSHAKKSERFKVQQLRFENDLAQIELIKRRHDKAIEIFEVTRQKARSLSLQDLQEITNNDLGHVYLQQQKYQQAIAYLSEDIQVYSTMKNREPLARALYSFAEAMHYTKNIHKAIEAYKESIRICKSSHFFPLLLRIYNGLGNLYLTQGKNEEALATYQKGLEISVRLKATTLKGALLFNQGVIHNRMKNFALSTRRFLMVKQVLENKNPKLAYDHLLLSKCYHMLADLAQEEKNSMKALSYQLERMKLVDHAETLRPELINVKMDLAALYLENRLKEQFLKEIADLETGVTEEKQIAQIKEMRAKWEEIEKNKEQENTLSIT